MPLNAENRNPWLLFLAGMGKSYFIKTPGWLKKIYPHRTWDKGRSEKTIYLSFDDGPEPEVTPFVLDELKKYQAQASFFCIGKNVQEHPALYRRILDEGHAAGNHTMHHVNGWKTKDEDYIADINEAAGLIQSELFRPPYGRIRSAQARKLKKAHPGMQIIMWDVLSGDFDASCTAAKCLENVQKYARPGSIVVFHDSRKAGEKLKQVLPPLLRFFAEKGYSFRRL